MINHLNELEAGLAAVDAWKSQWATMPVAPSLALSSTVMNEALGALAKRLEDNYPFHHPVYAGQMLKPPHPIAMIAYAMTMQINPNNHALDGGPATADLEREAVAQLAEMLGYGEHLGHLTSSGTIANLEALWIARSLHPGKAIAHSTQAHYTHARMGEVLGVRMVAIAVDDRGRIDLADLTAKLDTGDIGTVVVTPGTTGLGAIDPVDEVIAIAHARGVRVHVDAAYGGFYRLLTDLDPPMVAVAPFKAIAQADSIVIDPHKHGLQPYGCGCVLFRDPSVGHFYQHDSPYTYFTSKELHLGEISLECSRAGAAAAALWTTLWCFPLLADRGLGPVLQATRRAALAWTELIKTSQFLQLVMEPELDILAFFPLGGGWKASAITAESERVFEALMKHPKEPVYLAKVVLPRAIVAPHAPMVQWDAESVTVLRSCLLKPEHEDLVPYLHNRVEQEAWFPEADKLQRTSRSRTMTGSLNVRGEWHNMIVRYFAKIREALVADLREVQAIDFHSGVALVHIMMEHPYGVGGPLGLRLVTKTSDGEAFRLVPGPTGELGFTGSRAILPDLPFVVPEESRTAEQFKELNAVFEDTYQLTGKYLVEFFAECWNEAGGRQFQLPAYIGFVEDEDVYDLQSGEWVESIMAGAEAG